VVSFSNETHSPAPGGESLKQADQRDPVERYVPLAFKLAVYGVVSCFFVQAAATFASYTTGQSWPFLLGIFRMFTFLPIHEAGHLIFRFFGRTLNILGGSFWQVMFPLLWFIIALRQRSHVAPFALFWVGENLLDVSLYVRDAPVRQLPLLGGDPSGHDWHNLLADWNMMDSAETFADILYYAGFIISAGAILAGIYLAIRSLILPAGPIRYPEAKSTAEDVALEGRVSDYLENHNPQL
jgi:hypothetical protein